MRFPETARQVQVDRRADGDAHPVRGRRRDAHEVAIGFSSVTLGAVTITPLAGRTCSAGSVITSTSSPISLAPAVVIGANASNAAFTVPGALQMASTADDGCQGATFGVALTVAGAWA